MRLNEVYAIEGIAIRTQVMHRLSIIAEGAILERLRLEDLLQPFGVVFFPSSPLGYVKLDGNPFAAHAKSPYAAALAEIPSDGFGKASVLTNLLDPCGRSQNEIIVEVCWPAVKHSHL